MTALTDVPYIARFARAYSRPGQMAAAMGMYRVFDVNERFGKTWRGPLDVPIVLVAGDKSFGALLPAMKTGLEGTEYALSRSRR